MKRDEFSPTQQLRVNDFIKSAREHAYNEGYSRGLKDTKDSYKNKLVSLHVKINDLLSEMLKPL